LRHHQGSLREQAEWAKRVHRIEHDATVDALLTRYKLDVIPTKAAATRRGDMQALINLRKKRGWTQSEAAKRLGTTQPRVSALMKGVWRDFSADMLLVLATRVGLRPTLKLAA
jgi:predicted XRE-type DNA-binding protein